MTLYEQEPQKPNEQPSHRETDPKVISFAEACGLSESVELVQLRQQLEKETDVEKQNELLGQYQGQLQERSQDQVQFVGYHLLIAALYEAINDQESFEESLNDAIEAIGALSEELQQQFKELPFFQQ